MRMVRYVGEVVPTLPPQTAEDVWAMYTQFLLWAGISADAHDGAVVPAFHQASSNLMNLMTSATSEADMVTKLSQRFRPDKYLRPDVTGKKTLNPKVVSNAIDDLGDFTNTIMTVEELEALPACVKVGDDRLGVHGTTTSIGAFSAMLTDGPPRAGKQSTTPSAGAFAARCGKTAVSQLTTVQDLVEWVRAHPGADVRISTEGLGECYIAKTTLRAEARKVPHFWAFRTGGLKSTKRCTVQVTHVLPMWKYIPGCPNALFVCDVADRRTSLNWNCCFPAFLSAAYARRYAEVFERLNKAMQIGVPDGALAAGFGTSASNHTGLLLKPVLCTLNGVDAVLTRLY